MYLKCLMVCPINRMAGIGMKLGHGLCLFCSWQTNTFASMEKTPIQSNRVFNSQCIHNHPQTRARVGRGGSARVW